MLLLIILFTVAGQVMLLLIILITVAGQVMLLLIILITVAGQVMLLLIILFTVAGQVMLLLILFTVAGQVMLLLIILFTVAGQVMLLLILFTVPGQVMLLLFNRHGIIYSFNSQTSNVIFLVFILFLCTVLNSFSQFFKRVCRRSKIIVHNNLLFSLLFIVCCAHIFLLFLYNSPRSQKAISSFSGNAAPNVLLQRR